MTTRLHKPNLVLFYFWIRIAEDWRDVELFTPLTKFCQNEFKNIKEVTIFKKYKLARFGRKNKSRFLFETEKNFFKYLNFF